MLLPRFKDEIRKWHETTVSLNVKVIWKDVIGFGGWSKIVEHQVWQLINACEVFLHTYMTVHMHSERKFCK